MAAHGTHVAGTVGGDGRVSNGNDSQGIPNGGTAFQWRGMAPQVELIDAPSSAARTASNWLSYVNTDGLDVSNHSYSFSFDGAYDAQNQLRDQLIRGGSVVGGTTIFPRLQVYSAGNHGASPLNGGEQVGYFALTKQRMVFSSATLIALIIELLHPVALDHRTMAALSQTSSLQALASGRPFSVPRSVQHPRVAIFTV
jgi:hypothetical protein